MLDLFTPIADENKQHPIFKMMLQEQYQPERDVLTSWANGFEDRDGKFIYEFQTTFESSMWELYIHEFLKHLGAEIDFSHHAPDFVAELAQQITIEATIAAPPHGGEPAAGHGQKYPPHRQLNWAMNLPSWGPKHPAMKTAAFPNTQEA